MKRVAIIGGSGLTGRELQRLVEGHPEMDVAAFTSGAPGREPRAPMSPVDAHVTALDLEQLHGLDAAFLCTPHAASAPLAAACLERGLKIVDLSADFRLRNAKAFEATYATTHPHPELFERAVYGLTEHTRGRVLEADLVANPGCYPTSILLALRPLFDSGTVARNASIIADSKSGASGAGIRPSDTTHFGSVNENFKAYGVPRDEGSAAHRHLPEIHEHAGSTSIAFIPHLLPVWRGILSTLYVETDSSAKDVRNALSDAYATERFVHVFSHGLPELSRVAGTNDCHLGVGCAGDRIVIVACIDNLQKGAAGQALQNMNLMLGLEESLGLTSAVGVRA